MLVSLSFLDKFQIIAGSFFVNSLLLFASYKILDHRISSIYKSSMLSQFFGDSSPQPQHREKISFQIPSDSDSEND